MACWLLAEMLLKEIANEDDETVLAKIGQQLLSTSDAAKIIGGSQKTVRDRLNAAGVEPYISQRTGTPFFRRVDVERLYWQRHQLSLP